MIDLSTIILHEGEESVIVNKPTGIAVQSQEERDFNETLSTFLGTPLFVVHRLDQPTSGALLFAKSSQAAARYNLLLKEGKMRREYLAIVSSIPNPSQGILEHQLLASRTGNYMKVVGRPHGKRSILKYEHLASSDRYHLLKISLVTGRRHQIRAQLGAIGSPIRGDNKYGFKRGNRDRSIQLHAWRLSIEDETKLEITAPPPNLPIWRAFRIESL